VESHYKQRTQLTHQEDTKFALTGFGLVDLVDDRTFKVNALTNHLKVMPSAVNGMLHLEVLTPECYTWTDSSRA
jgi:hypothetical protein